jgi:3-phosphoshikimate 1-carboxyvinyltransferase
VERVNRSALASPLVVRPGPALSGTVTVPGDKSVTHRAYLIALLAAGETVVEHPNPGADCYATLAACRALGVEVREAGPVVRLHNPGVLHASGAAIDCGNSGSTMRMLPGVLASQPFEATLQGDESLHRRPVARIIEPLRMMGARLSARDGDRLPPLVIHGGALTGIRYLLPVASAQVATCVAFAAIRAAGETVIDIPGPARDHGERMLASAGAGIEIEPLGHGGRRVHIAGAATLTAGTLRVPGDLSSAAFFLAGAAAVPGARVSARGVGLNPTRTGFLDVLEAMGAAVDRTQTGSSGGEPIGDVTVVGPEHLRAFDPPASWLPRWIDEVPAWTIVASAAHGTSRLTGAGELRIKESDRIATLARGLAGIGVEASESQDGLAVTGGTARGGRVSSAGDHRIAMAFAVLGVHSREGVRIDDASAIPTSYPSFVADLRVLGGDVAPGPVEIAE